MNGAQLEVRLAGREYSFPPGTEIVIGRDPSADVRTENPYVSRRHARLAFEDGRWALEDTNSTRGLFHHGSRVSRVELTGPTEIWLGPPELGDRLELTPQGSPAGPPPADPDATRLPPSQADAGAGIRLGLDGRDAFFGPDATIRIGRDPGVDVHSPNPSVSRQHATISYQDGKWILEDQSRRGTFREGAAINRLEIDQPVTLRLGDPENGAVLTLTPVPTDAASGPGTSTLIRNFQRTTRRVVIGAVAIVLLVVGAATAVVVVATRDGDSNGKGEAALEGRGLSRLKAATVLLAGDPSDPEKTGWGSGTIVDKSGLILTNAHVASIANPPAPGLGAQYESPPEEGPESAGPLYVYTTNGTDEQAQPAYVRSRSRWTATSTSPSSGSSRTSTATRSPTTSTCRSCRWVTRTRSPPGSS